MIAMVNAKLQSCSMNLDTLKASSAELNADFAQLSSTLGRMEDESSRRASLCLSSSSEPSSRSSLTSCTSRCSTTSSSGNTSEDEVIEKTYVFVGRTVDGRVYECDRRRLRSAASSGCSSSLSKTSLTSSSDSESDLDLNTETSFDEKMLSETNNQVIQMLLKNDSVPE